ncbi:MAG TPA: GGDEF domain-containing protein [Dissulfurispiraceae bacterium]|nr:GGDEF domain-containing protein [Dissulfurispiraceae bacterium]
MSPRKTVLVISRDIVLTSIVDKILHEAGNLLFFGDFKSSLDFIYNSQPDLLILDLSEDSRTNINVLNDLKSDPIFGQIPAITIFADDFIIPSWEFLLSDDYLRRSAVEAELGKRVELCFFRSERIVEINPLTRLPGNITITRQIQDRLDRGEVFAVGYADIDFFKPFNDKYGFSRGDEVLKMVGRLIRNIVKERQPAGSFIGHVGGDDFIFIMDFEAIEETSGRITEYFDKLVPTFYDSADRESGYIASVDREGNKKMFPIMTISIGIGHTKFRTFAHYSEIGQIASELKHASKAVSGSCHMIDRRRK